MDNWTLYLCPIFNSRDGYPVIWVHFSTFLFFHCKTKKFSQQKLVYLFLFVSTHPKKKGRSHHLYIYKSEFILSSLQRWFNICDLETEPGKFRSCLLLEFLISPVFRSQLKFYFLSQ